MEESDGSGDLPELARGEELHRGEISLCRPVTPLTPIQLARAKLTNGFQIHYKINHKVQMWSKNVLMWPTVIEIGMFIYHEVTTTISNDSNVMSNDRFEFVTCAISSFFEFSLFEQFSSFDFQKQMSLS